MKSRYLLDLKFKTQRTKFQIKRIRDMISI